MTKPSYEDASWLKPLPDEYAKEGMTKKIRLILASVTAIVLIGFAVLLWFSYTSETEDMGIIPVVRADNSVVKEKPVEPGGKEILFQDKEVFDRVDNIPKEDQDVIASSAEIPLKRPVVEEVIKVEAPVEVTPEVVVAEKTEPVVAAASIGDFMIQIGAFADKSIAEAYWASATSKYAKILTGIDPIYMRVDLGARGVLYRVRGGMLEDRSAAETVCESLKSNNQNCLVVSN
ncbi:MAG: SPOR domain-containing protein [Kordiimonadaceae bacterium]|nr:SPOR domain-containing protein [Kordiimonadaceae bacterium]MBT6031351.1 SPOR domain-containing protein [Kordiimonadaceae bacterium]